MNTLCEAEVLPHQNCDDPASVYPEDGMKIKPVTVGTFAVGEGLYPDISSYVIHYRFGTGRSAYLVDYSRYPRIW